MTEEDLISNHISPAEEAEIAAAKEAKGELFKRLSMEIMAAARAFADKTKHEVLSEDLYNKAKADRIKKIQGLMKAYNDEAAVQKLLQEFAKNNPDLDFTVFY